MSGVETPTDASSFYAWTRAIRGDRRLIVTNELPGGEPNPEPDATVWAAEECDDLLDVDGVVIADKRTATGDAPAVRGHGVKGWTRYDICWKPTDGRADTTDDLPTRCRECNGIIASRADAMRHLVKHRGYGGGPA